MSDFLMIVPEGYTEISGEEFTNATGLDPYYGVEMLSAGTYWELYQPLENMGLIVDGQRVTDWRVFDAGRGLNIWFRLEADI